jgi:hypothetical protein
VLLKLLCEHNRIGNQKMLLKLWCKRNSFGNTGNAANCTRSPRLATARCSCRPTALRHVIVVHVHVHVHVHEDEHEQDEEQDEEQDHCRSGRDAVGRRRNPLANTRHP